LRGTGDNPTLDHARQLSSDRGAGETIRAVQFRGPRISHALRRARSGRATEQQPKPM
jgi:hypothetical protein